ncbi:prolyl oligopeptidase family serine peptidase [Gluconacetobacter entanii]|uniref:prolyl oligopeptidase family serine peptidase n=1 Tax=Gluconacetobacter entanii TaxID=108528 RepID=UPI0021BBC8C5|nr:prolyl oligopeptidase family serine peptidase [Gluconacetobacter entanii]MCW4581371.1 prolyl oligopeptidase family serine peptidase [Gluconacetobacter entanii]MCW4584789.1 prolyl oligopeptidase family serine peptidase [Gluconacetobacter entanii]MCW4588203.1 prolyl oligopeptidase family serine peptidase [Gluconacetobacter entanii]
MLRSKPLLFSLLVMSMGSTAWAADRGVPFTPAHPVSQTYHGVRVTDPYRWLENSDDPKVIAWSDAQNARTRAYLDHLAQRQVVFDRLMAAYRAQSPSYSDFHLAGGHVFAQAVLPPHQQPVVGVMNGRADPKTFRTIIDPDRIDPSGQTTIDWSVPSPDGRLLAVSLSQNGTEDGTVHVFDTKTGAETADIVPRAQYPTAGGSLAWKADSSGFWYTRYPGDERPEADRHFYQQVWYHRLGTPVSQDAYVAGRDFPKIAEIALDNYGVSQNGHAVLISVEEGDGGRFQQYVINQKSGQVTRISDFDDRVVAAAIGPDDHIYLVSRKNAPRGELLETSLEHPAVADAKRLIAQGEGVIMGGAEFGGAPVIATRKALYVREMVGGPSRVAVFSPDGKPRGDLSLPPVISVSDVSPIAHGDMLVSFNSYLTPHQVMRYRPGTGKLKPTPLSSTSPVSFADCEAVRAEATSRDGTHVPMTVIRRRGTRLDGRNPTLVYGYGGYGISEMPRFMGAWLRAWLDAGGVYVDTNLRGGGEFGATWHEDGALTHKQNVFDDFAAVSRQVIADGYTSSSRLAALGGSNGGLLMGAAMTQTPELYRAVVSLVGIYDMTRIELDPNGAFNVTEFGTVRDPAQFHAMLSYSPYQAVRPGVKYPAVFMATGTHDGRVNPAQSRKMIAKLQADTASGYPVYLSISDKAGHGMGSAVNVRLGQTADYVAFLLDQLGMKL